jgi:peroxiredoxin
MSGAFYVSYAALWALVVFETLVLLGLVKKVYRSRLEAGAAEDVPYGLTGHMVPHFEVTDVFGKTISSVDLKGSPSALLFVSPDCSNCAATLIELEALMSKVRGRVVVVCRAKPDKCVSLAHHYDLSVPVVCDEDRSLSDTFSVMAPPTAVLISPLGQIERYGQPMSAEEFESLMTERTEDGRPRTGDNSREADLARAANGNGTGELVLHHQGPTSEG